jgi:hypothetical protein
MRTTVDINTDLLERLRKLADAEGISFKDALNRAITRGLAEAPATAVEPYRLPDLRIGIPAAWDARRLKQFLHDEDVERYLRTAPRSSSE